jgi:hypothetical protein
MHAVHLFFCEAEVDNLEFKPWPKQLWWYTTLSNWEFVKFIFLVNPFFWLALQAMGLSRRILWFGLSIGSIRLGINYSVLNQTKQYEQCLNTQDFRLVNYLFSTGNIHSKIGQTVTKFYQIFEHLN